MRSKLVWWVVFGAVVSLASFQVYGLIQPPSNEDNSEVLAATTTLTLEERVTFLENRVLTLERNIGLVKPKTTSKMKERFVTLAGGTMSGGEWVKISGTDFSLDSALYGSSVEISWQGWIEGGYGSVRLYDATNYRAVDSSEISVDSGVRSSFYSKPVSIWRGQNAYYIEGKNPWGELTVSEPRLRVITR